ncbi:MAG: carboxypeptidase-like regulatory domain-containing protein [Acidobacteriota bacterium]|nr:carboxypeptidase-like regulatory domain-containing protein [Acidobacteriota bacterium]
MLRRPFLLRTLLPLLTLIASLAPSPVWAQSGGVEGTVTGPTGQPLADVEVALYQAGSHGWRVVAWQYTAADGSYGFAAVADGDYRLSFRDWAQNWAFEYYDEATDLDDAMDIVVAGGVVTVDEELQPAGRIAGTVLDPAGRPLEVAQVFVYTDEAEPEVLFLDQPDPVTGAWEVGGLPTGSYLVLFTGRQGLDQYSSYYDDADSAATATPVAVTAGATTEPVSGVLGLPPGGTLSGSIVDPYGRAYDFARVLAYLPDGAGGWELAGSAETDYYEEGYSLRLAPGPYRLRFEAGSFLLPDDPGFEVFDDQLTLGAGTDVVIAVGTELENFDVVVGDLATGSVAGTVTDAASGLPVADAAVYLSDRRGRVLWDQVATTAADGSFTVGGLWPEAYTVEVFDPLFRYQTLELPSPVPVVDNAAVTGIDAALTAAPAGSLPGTLEGTVSDELSGAPVLGIEVQASTAGVESHEPGYASTRALTDSAGFFRLRGLPAGSYVVRFRSPVGEWVTEYYNDVPSAEFATPVVLADGLATQGIDAALRQGGGIAGTILNPFGQPFSLSTATAFSFDGNQWQPVGSDFSLREAQYRITGLPPGTYRVGFSGGSWTGPRFAEFYDDVELIELGTDVPVIAGQLTTGIDAELGEGPGGAISGIVTDGVGGALEGISVTFYDHDLELLSRSAITDASGAYTLDLLFSGVYYVRFEDPSGTYPAEFYDDVDSLQRATPVQVSGAPVTGIDAALDGSGSGPGGGGVQGVVTEEGTSLPVEGIEVSCVRADSLDFVAGCETLTAADGTYTLGGFLPAGDYLVRFRSTDGSYANEYYDGVVRPDLATPVAVSLGAFTAGIDAALEPAGAISGGLTRNGGTSSQLFTITALIFDGSQWQPYKSTFVYDQSAYRLAGLPAGTYRIFFTGRSLGSTQVVDAEYYDDVAAVEDGTDVTVTVGQTTAGIDADLGNLPANVVGFLVDPGFDGGLEAWSQLLPESSSVTHGRWDRRGDLDSGTAEVRYQGGPGEQVVLSQCLAVEAGSEYRQEGWARLLTAATGEVVEEARTSFYGDAQCAGSFLGEAVAESRSLEVSWSRLHGRVQAPSGAVSARVEFVLEARTAPGFEAVWDDLDFVPVQAVFTDSFEVGSAESWSRVVGGSDP